jgi:hypothetical protein
MQWRNVGVLSVAIAALLAGSSPAAAQITTGTVTGSVKDSQGGVVPGATVVLISEARGTRLAPVVTNETGDYVVPNVTADVYTVEVTMDAFRTVRRAGIRVSGGDRVGVPVVTLEAGAIAETVNVTADSALVQTQTAERSFAVAQEQIENLPFNRGNFINAVQFTPGVILGAQGGAGTAGAAGATRLGGAGQNNIMMDGASAMDTGNNGQMLSMNTESIGEVKILTQGYQAEFGRSSGLQITAVTKSGTNRFRGSVYDVERDTSWNSNSWVNRENGDPKPIQDEKDWGYSIGGPIGKPGGNNKLFFFYAHEYRPRNSPINNGNPIRLRLPTALERQGDFSQTRDNQGRLFNLVRDHQSGLPCTAADTRGCFQDGGVLGRIPQNRLYGPGRALLNRYPLPNLEQQPNTNWNYEIPAPQVENLIQQPAVRIDYQLSSNWRITAKYSGQRQRVITRPGIIPGFSDSEVPYPYITNYAFTGNWTINPTTFLEGTYGFIRNELAGGNEQGVLVNDASNRLTSMPGFPLLYPDAGVVNERYYAHEVMEDVQPPFWDGRSLNLPPIFGWGGRIGGVNALPSPPNQRYPGWLNINRTQDVAISLTKVIGRHTLKAGFYNNHSFKAQNVGAGGIANLSFQGFVNFGNDVNNALDTGFGYANAATGIFTQYLQASNFVEGSMIYDNTEFYLQDNWKVNNRLTLDYGVRFTRQGPQYDQFQQMSNFFPERWNPGQAQVLYVPGCSNGATVCSGDVLNAMDPRTGQILTAPGTRNTQAAIATPISGSGDPFNGIVQAGDGIAETGYTWPALVVGPRFGMAYDLTGTQTTVLRAGGGLFYDRPDGNTVFSIPGNPPIATAQDLRYGQLQTLGQGLTTQPIPSLVIFQYDAKVPASWQWQVGVQRALPWAMAVDVAYVGNHGFNRLGSFQGGSTVNLNAIDFGSAYLPENQDPTEAPNATPGASAFSTNLLRPFAGLGNINQQTTEFSDTYHSIQLSVNRRFRNGFSFGANYTGQLSLTGNTGLQKRLEHLPDGSIQIRADQEQYEELNKDLGGRTHYLKANGIWAFPRVPQALGRVAGLILNDWQIAGVLTLATGAPYDLGFSYQGIGSVNLTGSPDYAARVVFVGDPGDGCSGDRYRMFNVDAVRGPTFNSVGLESGRNILRDCADKFLDLSVSRDIRLGGNRTLEFRVDVYNALNTVVFTDFEDDIDYNNPTSLTILNSQTLPDGSLNPQRLTPRTAGFGAATGAANMRSMQVQIRFSF